MNDCLITNFKGSATNPDLPILGSFEIRITAAPAVSNNLYLRNYTKAYMKNSGREYSSSSNISFTAEDVGDTLVVVDNYELKQLGYFCTNVYNTCQLRTEDIKYRPINHINLNSNILVGNIEDLTFGEIVECEIEAQINGLSGNVTKIIKEHGSTSLIKINLSNSRTLSGQISDLIKFINVETLFFDNCSLIIGTLEEFVSGQRTNGRDSATRIAIGLNLGNVTFKEKTLSNISGESPTQHRKFLSWNSNGVITIERLIDGNYEDITNLY